MFAELDGNSWVLMIGAIFLGLAKIVEMVLTYFREIDKAKRIEQVAKHLEVQDVKMDSVAAEADKKIDSVANQVEQIHIATNSMREQMVNDAGIIGHGEGVKDEKARAADVRQRMADEWDGSTERRKDK